jgi:hypothetical protein
MRTTTALHGREVEGATIGEELVVERGQVFESLSFIELDVDTAARSRHAGKEEGGEERRGDNT